MTKKRDPRGASRKSPQEKNPDPNFMTSATSNKLITVEGVEYPAEIQFPRLDVRAALIHHWLDKSFVIHPTKGKIGLVPKLGMAIAELADRYAKPGLSYVDLFSAAAKHGLIGHPDLFETPGTGSEGLG